MIPDPPTLRDEINIADSPLDINPLEFKKGFLGFFLKKICSQQGCMLQCFAEGNVMKQSILTEYMLPKLTL